MKEVKIYIALPLMNESAFLPELLASLKKQDFSNFRLIACVNQPDHWWEDELQRSICQDNILTLRQLKDLDGIECTVIDRCSPGKGWDRKHYGVGWARRIAMDEAAKQANDDDIMVTLDGDTTIDRQYLSSLVESFNKHPGISGITIPYYHKLTGDELADRAILRYEIYMRYYLLNMLRINNPYAFTAIGSAIAVTMKNYKRIGGITPFKSGEDFYFAQKLAKAGPLLIWNEEIAYPAARFSDRVFFGTGPAMIKGSAGDWSSYPIYDHHLFSKVEETFGLFGELWNEDRPTPMDTFLHDRPEGNEIWSIFRKNYTRQDQFINACIRKIDGLRILQFLRKNQKDSSDCGKGMLSDFLKIYFPDTFHDMDIDWMNINLERSPSYELNQIRNILFDLEMQKREERRIVGIT